ncbi:MAG: hypothetical protein ACR2JH_00205 [Solirubrobacteraceae bacterium]
MGARFRRAYGASPLHLLALLASVLIAGTAAVGWFDNTAPITERILIWFLGAVIGHDLVLLPLYSLLDRVAFGTTVGRQAHTHESAAGWAYLRVPALLSGLLFLVFFPEILRLGDATFHTASGLHQDVYLLRYLLTCAGLFALSGLTFAASLARARRRPGPRAPRSAEAISEDTEVR